MGPRGCGPSVVYGVIPGVRLWAYVSRLANREPRYSTVITQIRYSPNGIEV